MEKYLLILTIVVLLFIAVKLWYANFKQNKRRKKSFKRGIKLEKKASKFLQKKGFTILEEQAEFTHYYRVNNKQYSSLLVVDYLVTKNNKTYVVEVKSGSKAIHIQNKATRRQILEYAVAIPCDGVFLLDMENKHLSEIKFENIQHKKKQQNCKRTATHVL